MTERSEGRRIGEVVGGKYRLLRFLASGGMGVVYEAQHTLVKRRFALKFLRPELTKRRESLARFQREAEAAGALESENVAAAIDFGIAADGSPYIVMEYLVGESVASLLERHGRLPLERATDLVAQACRGMQAAHAAGIVHRDLKPQNLFVCRREDGTDLVKVLDFGVAKLVDDGRPDAATATGALLGTPAYMSPEQARGEKNVDRRADIYALGAIVYELLSGEKPHRGESHNAVLHHIATQPALPLDFVEPPLPPSLVAAVERSLSSDPDARFESAEELGGALSGWALRTAWPVSEQATSIPLHGSSAPTELAPKALGRARAETVELAGTARRKAMRIGVWKGALVAGASVLAAVALLSAPSEPSAVGPVMSSAAASIPAEPARLERSAAEKAPAAREVRAVELAASSSRAKEVPPLPVAERVAPELPPARRAPATHAGGGGRRPAPQAPEREQVSPLAVDRNNPYE